MDPGRTSPLPESWGASWPPTRFSEWRVRSNSARVVDWVVGIAGAVLIGLSLLDAAGSFWHNHVFIYPGSLERIGELILLPSWPWILASSLMIAGIPRRRKGWWRPRAPLAGWRRSMPWITALMVVFGVVIAGFALGASKGSLRVLSGGVHQVSTLDLNEAHWTTVSASDYNLWAARFVREDAFFAVFGLIMVGWAVWLRDLRRRLVQSQTEASDPT